MPTNIDYVRQLLDGFRSNSNIRWGNGVPLNLDGTLNEDANLASQYMSMYDTGTGSAPSWADFQRQATQYNAPDIYRGMSYENSTGAPIQISRTAGQSGASPWLGSPASATSTNPSAQAGAANSAASSVPSNAGMVPISGGSSNGAVTANNATPTNSAVSGSGGLLGGWNTRGQLSNTPSLSNSVGTSPINLSGGMWNLGGNFSGTARAPFAPQGYENWNPNDPRSLSPGAVSMSGGRTYTPRTRADLYGAGLRNPHMNSFQQYGQAMAMSNPILPTFNWSRRSTPTEGS
jgi:hypothetical protein